MRKPERHIDTGHSLLAFADEVLVTCSACGTPGIVHAARSSCGWCAAFVCGKCGLALSSEKGDWAGAVQVRGRRPCGYCGYQWLTPCKDFDAPPVNPPAELPATCPTCGREALVTTTIVRAIPDDHCCDPHFGLPLHLTTSTRHGTVWAYNLHHVNELTAYVGAQLRERQTSYHKTMLAHLPKWMKLAKHRTEIVKALGKLRTMGS